MLPTSIQIWGDSIARGVIYDEKRGRYAISRERCSDQLQKTLGIEVENHAKMGATSEDGLALFSQAQPKEGALCAFVYGGNDCDLDWEYVSKHEDETVEAKVPLDKLRQNLAKLVTMARERLMVPLLVLPTPLHAKRYFAWVTKGLDAQAVERALGTVEAIYRWQERYAIAVAQVATEMDCKLFNARDAVLSHQRDFDDMLCLDGIHPSDLGHRAISLAAIEACARA